MYDNSNSIDPLVMNITKTITSMDKSIIKTNSTTTNSTTTMQYITKLIAESKFDQAELMLSKQQDSSEKDELILLIYFKLRKTSLFHNYYSKVRVSILI